MDSERQPPQGRRLKRNQNRGILGQVNIWILPMRNIKLIIQYDGTNYAGWQFQKNAKSIQEIIEAINLHFKLALTEGEENAIQGYIDEVSKDPEIIRDITANISKDLDRFFEISLKEKLYMKFMDYFMHYNIDKVSYYIEKGLEAFINKSLFNRLVDKIKKPNGFGVGGLELEL